MTDAELALWSRLRMNQLARVKFRRQQPIGPYIADFVSFEQALIVEVDGGQHAEESNARNDAERTRYLASRGFRVVRFWNHDVLTGIDDVLAQLLRVLEGESPSP